MTCPFLREARVWGCRSSNLRKLIPQSTAVPPGTRCLDGGYIRCPSFSGSADAASNAADVCPNLVESIAQYCAAAPVTKFIPYSEAVLIRCGSSAYRYCDQYLDQTGPGRGALAEGHSFSVPDDLLYASRHWWFDLVEEGPWHAGLDAFTARLTGAADRVGFIPARAGSAPAVVLTAGDRDFTFALPECLSVTATNLQLRLHPGRIFEDPYSRGWIFEGLLIGRQGSELRQRLWNARRARIRMEEDARLVNELLHQYGQPECATLGDGGLFEAGILTKLDRDAACALMHELASTPPGMERD